MTAERSIETVTITRQEYKELRKIAREAKEGKAVCYSKKFMILSWVITILLTIATVYGHFCTDKDITALATVCGMSWAETATATGFYYWKARSENKIKLTLCLVDKLAQKYGIDAVVQLAGITFNS